MSTASTQRDFLRYRDRGDVEALARVFDALGPRLLLLAFHLCREPHAAEDLVQQTFVEAMRTARRFDAARPLEAWLAGILRHVATDRQRRHARRPEHGEDGLEGVAAAERGPLEQAIDDEHLSRVRGAIDALPPPYREVAILRLVHGLEPIAIARALGRPAGTVRVQCLRALEQLRRALPAGLAGAVALLAPGRAWAAVRAGVIESAAAVAPVGAAAAPAILVAGLITRKSAAVIALGVLATGVGWAALRTSGDAGRSRVPAAATLAGNRGIAAEPEAHDAQRPPLPRSEASGVRAAVHALTGRVTLAPDDAPASGARVVLRATRGASGALFEARADAAGRYRIDLAPLHSWSPVQRALAHFEVVATTGEGVSGAQQLEPLPDDFAAGWTPVVDLHVERRVRVTGRVLHRGGAGAAAVRVVLTGRPPDVPPGSFAGTVQYDDTTDADGRFTVFVPRGPAACFTIGAASFAQGMAYRDLGVRTPDAAIDVGTLELDAQHVVAGVLETEDGTPAGDLAFDLRSVEEAALRMIHVHPIPIVADGSVAPWTHLNTHTDSDGRFVCAGLAPGRYLLRVRDLFGTAQEFEVETGPGQQRLVLEGQLVRVTVRDRSGARLPGARFEIRAWPPEEAPDASEVMRAERACDRLRPPPRLALPEELDEHGRFACLVPTGTFVIAGSVVRGGAFALETARALPGIAHQDVLLVLDLPERPGLLRVAVRDDAGARVDRVGLRIWPALAELPVAAFDPGAIGTAALPLPAGTWRWSAFGGPELAGVSGLIASYGTVAVRAGETTELEVTLRRGGWLRLRPRMADGSALPELVAPRVRLGEHGGSGIDVAVLGADGATRPVARVRPGDAIVPLGAFAPGTVTFRLTARLGRADGAATVVPEHGRSELASEPITVRIAPLEATEVDVPLHAR